MYRYTVYSLFGKDDEPLYVGFTRRSISRILTHCQGRAWAEEITVIRIERFDTQHEGLSRETDLIKSLAPRYNYLHNPIPPENVTPDLVPERARIRAMDGEWLTLKEAGAELGLYPQGLRNQIIRGSLRGVQIGKLWAVSREEVERYRRDNQHYATKPGRYRS